MVGVGPNRELCRSTISKTDPHGWTRNGMLNRWEPGNSHWPLSTNNTLWGIISSLWTWPLLESEDRALTAQIRFLPTNCLRVAEANADPFSEMIVSDSLVCAGYWKELNCCSRGLRWKISMPSYFEKELATVNFSCWKQSYKIRIRICAGSLSTVLLVPLIIYTGWPTLCNTLLQFFPTSESGPYTRQSF